MGYGWELGYMSLKEMEEVKIHGLGIERDLYFKPTKLHEIAELEEIVRGQYTKEPIIEEIKDESRQEVQKPVQEDNQPQAMVEQVEEVLKVEEAAPVLHTEPETEPAPEGVPVITL